VAPMAVARLRFLDRGEEELVHATSLKWLEKIGVMVKSQKVLALLEQAGASVDRDKGIAKMSEDMVKDAVSKAPKKITLGARDPKNEKVINDLEAERMLVRTMRGTWHI